MSEQKNAKYIITEGKMPELPPDNATMKMIKEQRESGNYLDASLIVNLNDSPASGAFFTECLWMKDKKGIDPNMSELPHAHGFDEAWIFAGTDRDNPRGLGGELNFNLEDENYIIDKSCIVFVPKGMKHGPCGINRIDRPFLFINLGNGAGYGRTWEDDGEQKGTVSQAKKAKDELKNSQYIITENTAPPPPAEFRKRIEEQKKSGNYMDSTRMFGLDASAAKGGFYIDCNWLWEKNGTEGIHTEIAHTHDFDEVLGFISGQKDNPRELNGEIEFWLEDEKYTITKTCLIFVPRGMKHLPLVFHRIDSPVFFFTTGNGSSYTRSSGNES